MGICSRAAVGHLLGGRYGVPLYGNQSVANFLLPNILILDVHSSVLAVLKGALSRPAVEFNDDVGLVDEAGDYVGLIPPSTLVELQSDSSPNRCRCSTNSGWRRPAGIGSSSP